MADQQIQAIVRDLENLGARVVAKITLDVTANLIDTTPVDSGWARANWVPDIGFGSTDTVGTREAVSIAEQQAGMAKILGYRWGQGPVSVNNNVPYIRPLNNGHSQQAPAGFVERAIERAVTVDLQGLEQR